MSFWYASMSPAATLRSVNTFLYRLADGFTIAAWANVLSTADIFFETRDIGNNTFVRLGWNGGNSNLSCRNASGATGSITLSATMNVGEWWFLCARGYSSNALLFYAKDATAGATYQDSIPNAPLETVMRQYTCFAGPPLDQPVTRSYLVAHAALWNRPIADADVERLAAGECPAHVRADALMVYFPLSNSGVCAAGHRSQRIFLRTAGQSARWNADPTFVRRMRRQRAFPLGFEDSGPPPPPPVLLRPRIAWFAGA